MTNSIIIKKKKKNLVQQSHTLTLTVITNSACYDHYQKIMSSHGFSPHGWAHPLGLIRYFPSVLFCFVIFPVFSNGTALFLPLL
jgi:hypothetical protein